MTKLKRILLLLGRTLAAVLLGYAVLFSLVLTVVLVVVGMHIGRPVYQVKNLVSENPVETAFMRQCRKELRKKGLPDTLEHTVVPLDSISPFLQQAVLAAEDDGFYSHPGFDVAAILAAMEHNRSGAKSKHGGSTITQQLAKNLFLTKARTFERKYKELAYAVLLETVLGKDRILELYLNYAQWGKTIFGCEAAAQHYYGKSCSRLTHNQAVRMAAILALPTKLTPWRTNSKLLPKRIWVIVNNLYRRGRITDSLYTVLLGVPPPQPEESDTTGQSEEEDGDNESLE